MKAIKKGTARLISRRAVGPFSYLTWPKGIKQTVISSHWVDGELILIEIPASQFIVNAQRAKALTEVEQSITRLSNIAINLSEPELITLQHSLITILDGINLRYDAPKGQGAIDENSPDEA